MDPWTTLVLVHASLALPLAVLVLGRQGWLGISDGCSTHDFNRRLLIALLLAASSFPSSRPHCPPTPTVSALPFLLVQTQYRLSDIFLPTRISFPFGCCKVSRYVFLVLRKKRSCFVPVDHCSCPLARAPCLHPGSILCANVYAML